MSMMAMDDVSYSYQDGAEDVLEHVFLEMAGGELLTILGPNLAGKTTLSKILLREWLHQTVGKTRGKICFSDSLRGSLFGYVFEELNWGFANIYVDEELAFSLENQGVPQHEMREIVDGTLREFELSHLRRRQICTLSGGEMQRVAIASMLVSSPKLIVTDDLLSNLDVTAAEELPRAVRVYCTKNGTSWLDLSRRWANHHGSFESFAFLNDGKLGGKIRHAELAKVFAARAAQNAVGLWPPHLDLLKAANKALARHDLEPIEGTTDARTVSDAVAKRFRAGTPTSRETPSHLRPILEVQEVSFGYDARVKVLSNCSIALYEGSINIIAGPNGCGKTTLAKICAGLLKPKDGALAIRGSIASRGRLRDAVAMVFQSPEYHFIMPTAFEDLTFAGKVAGLSKRESRDQANELLNSLGLEDRTETDGLLLSVGEQRRLAVGIALARRPLVLIVDEPTLNQDAVQSEILGSILRRSAKSGTAVVLISHDMDFAFRFGDAISILDNGVTAWTGSCLDAFLDSSGTTFAGRSDLLTYWSLFSDETAWLQACPRNADEMLAALIPIPR